MDKECGGKHYFILKSSEVISKNLSKVLRSECTKELGVFGSFNVNIVIFGSKKMCMCMLNQGQEFTRNLFE